MVGISSTIGTLLTTRVSGELRACSLVLNRDVLSSLVEIICTTLYKLRV